MPTDGSHIVDSIKVTLSVNSIIIAKIKNLIIFSIQTVSATEIYTTLAAYLISEVAVMKNLLLPFAIMVFIALLASTFARPRVGAYYARYRGDSAARLQAKNRPLHDGMMTML